MRKIASLAHPSSTGAQDSAVGHARSEQSAAMFRSALSNADPKPSVQEQVLRQ